MRRTEICTKTFWLSGTEKKKTSEAVNNRSFDASESSFCLLLSPNPITVLNPSIRQLQNIPSDRLSATGLLLNQRMKFRSDDDLILALVLN